MQVKAYHVIMRKNYIQIEDWYFDCCYLYLLEQDDLSILLDFKNNFDQQGYSENITCVWDSFAEDLQFSRMSSMWTQFAGIYTYIQSVSDWRKTRAKKKRQLLLLYHEWALNNLNVSWLVRILTTPLVNIDNATMHSRLFLTTYESEQFKFWRNRQTYRMLPLF